jgi:hypothetical protein
MKSDPYLMLYTKVKLVMHWRSTSKNWN